MRSEELLQQRNEDLVRGSLALSLEHLPAAPEIAAPTAAAVSRAQAGLVVAAETEAFICVRAQAQMTGSKPSISTDQEPAPKPIRLFA
jgi:hypothetical protein